ncbi:MAG: hypothetical protein V1880_01185 [Patescibacteria group bacterium]
MNRKGSYSTGSADTGDTHIVADYDDRVDYRETAPSPEELLLRAERESIEDLMEQDPLYAQAMDFFESLDDDHQREWIAAGLLEFLEPQSAENRTVLRKGQLVNLKKFVEAFPMPADLKRDLAEEIRRQLREFDNQARERNQGDAQTEMMKPASIDELLRHLRGNANARLRTVGRDQSDKVAALDEQTEALLHKTLKTLHAFRSHQSDALLGLAETISGSETQEQFRAILLIYLETNHVSFSSGAFGRLRETARKGPSWEKRLYSAVMNKQKGGPEAFLTRLRGTLMPPVPAAEMPRAKLVA